MTKVETENQTPDSQDTTNASDATTVQPGTQDPNITNTGATEPNLQSAATLQSDTTQATQPTTASVDQPAATPQSTDTASKIAELLGDLQRTRADFENYRKQTEGQKSLAMSATKYATVEKFLPLVDDFERALSAYPDQLAPLRKNLDKTLQSLGLAQINSAPDTEFNPDFHEAVSVEESDGEIEVIAETLRPGYLYDGTVVRPAMVKVKRK